MERWNNGSLLGTLHRFVSNSSLNRLEPLVQPVKPESYNSTQSLFSGTSSSMTRINQPEPSSVGGSDPELYKEINTAEPELESQKLTKESDKHDVFTSVLFEHLKHPFTNDIEILHLFLCLLACILVPLVYAVFLLFLILYRIGQRLCDCLCESVTVIFKSIWTFIVSIIGVDSDSDTKQA